MVYRKFQRNRYLRNTYHYSNRWCEKQVASCKANICRHLHLKHCKNTKSRIIYIFSSQILNRGIKMDFVQTHHHTRIQNAKCLSNWYHCKSAHKTFLRIIWITGIVSSIKQNKKNEILSWVPKRTVDVNKRCCRPLHSDPKAILEESKAWKQERQQAKISFFKCIPKQTLVFRNHLQLTFDKYSVYRVLQSIYQVKKANTTLDNEETKFKRWIRQNLGNNSPQRCCVTWQSPGQSCRKDPTTRRFTSLRLAFLNKERYESWSNIWFFSK